MLTFANVLRFVNKFDFDTLIYCRIFSSFTLGIAFVM
jgi:hypothetical protein